MARTLVVIPTFNERENISAIVSRVRDAVPEASVLVVDDASPDGTGEVADGLAVADERVHVLHRTGKPGLGAAYLEAFGWAFDRDYGPIVQLDADGSHRPEQLPRLLERSAEPGVDVVLGSRWIEGGSVVNWPRHREWLSRAASGYARTLLRLRTRDVTAGYRVFSADALRTLHIEDVHTRGYGFQVDMLWHAHRAGLTVVEEPITFVERDVGRSKMTPRIVLEAMLQVTAWGARGLVPGRKPPRRAASIGSRSAADAPEACAAGEVGAAAIAEGPDPT